MPVFVSDIKGDLSGLGSPCETGERIMQRARDPVTLGARRLSVAFLFAGRMADQAKREPVANETPAKRWRQPKPEKSAIEMIANSPLTRTVAGIATRGLMGALLGAPPRRKHRGLF